ncbi:hypothetical protein Acsp04_51590 [Actinomadura sp. NBRC 104425]|nr:hypothetical protein Acsp04_51590 [Actinomadura sp. NBRC 104425]
MVDRADIHSRYLRNGVGTIFGHRSADPGDTTEATPPAPKFPPRFQRTTMPVPADLHKKSGTALTSPRR